MITITSHSKSINLADRGIHVEFGGIEDFLSTAPIKTPPTNHWYEGDGVEVDLTEVQLTPRTIKIPLITDKPQTLRQLATELIDLQKFTITHHTGIQREVYFEGAELTPKGGVIPYAMDLTLREFAPTPPSATTPTPWLISGIEEPTIDGSPLSAYGFQKLESNHLRHFAKEGILINEEYHPRQEPNRKTYSTKLVLTSVGANCVQNYQALIHQLTKPGTHTLNSHKVYYKQARVTAYNQKGSYIILQLDLQII